MTTMLKLYGRSGAQIIEPIIKYLKNVKELIKIT